MNIPLPLDEATGLTIQAPEEEKIIRIFKLQVLQNIYAFNLNVNRNKEFTSTKQCLKQQVWP